MKYWDITVLTPIIISICFTIVILMLRKEKLSKNALLFCLEVAIFWLCSSLLGYELVYLKDSLARSLENRTYLIILLIISLIFIIILKPFATFITGIIKSRKLWMYLSYASVILLTLLMNFLKVSNIYVFIIYSILYAFILSTSTIHYLFLNEQYFYRINTLPVTWVIYTIIGFSGLLGTFIGQLQTIVLSSENFTYTNLFVLLFIPICLYLNFTQKENKNLASSFDESIRSQLPRKNNWNFFTIYIITFLVSCASTLSMSLTTKMFIAFQGIYNGYSNDLVETLLRLYDFNFIIPSVLISYLIFKFATPHFNQKYLLFTSFFTLFLLYVVLAFNKNPFTFMILNILIGVCYTQIIYSLFSFCMFWNYRAPKNPVTGFFGSALFGGMYLNQVIEETLLNSKVGVFKYFKSVDEILKTKQLLTNDSIIYESFIDSITVIMTLSSLLVLLAMFIFYFTHKYIFADYINPRLAVQNLKIILKKRVIEKTKTQIKVDELDNNEM